MRRTLAGWVLILWLLLPLLPLAIWSFARGWRFPDVLPQVWTTDAWAIAFSQRAGVIESLGLTALIAAAVTLAALIIGVPAGRVLGLHEFRGKRAVQVLILAPIIVPGLAVAMGLHGVFSRLGLTNTLAGVMLVHLVPTLPYVILVMAGIFANHETAHEEQARSLGATGAQVFRHVTLPAILPGVMVAGLFCFLVSFSQYALTLLIGGGRVITLPLLLFSSASAGRNDLTGAIALLTILPGLVILLLTARHLTGRNRAITMAGQA